MVLMSQFLDIKCADSYLLDDGLKAVVNLLFRRRVSLITILLFSVLHSIAQTIPCDHKAYIIGSEFRDLNLNNLQSNNLPTNPDFEADAIGYNVRDEKIYGLTPNNYHLMSIDGNGTVEDLGIPEGLDLNFNYVAGDVAPEGKRLFVLAQNKTTGIDERFYTIRLEPPYFAGFLSVTSIEDVALGDIAFDPLLDKVYGYDNRQNKVVSLSSGGNITSHSTVSTPHTIGSLFFDEFGVLYGVENSKLIEFNKHTGEVLSVKNISNGGIDGCSCPYQLDFFQIINPPKIVPCSEAIITYYFDNRAGTSYGDIGIEAILPDGFTITEIIEKPFFGTVENGLGSNIFEVVNMQVLLGVDSFSIRVYLDETVTGTYDLQAKAFYFPQAFGTEMSSDNPYTIELSDPTKLKVLTNEKNLFEDDFLYLCEGGELTLETNLNGVDFLWNDGSTQPNLTVNEPGEYWVEIKNNCGIFRDFIQVKLEENPLFIDLGEDFTLNYGQNQTLSYASNSTDLSFQWSADTPEYLNCETCSNPNIQPFENTQYYVTVTNENGCTATDDILIKIEDQIEVYAPNVFSPNKDGINDAFYLQSGGNFRLKSFQIFDRWGNLVFDQSDIITNEPSNGWNGKVAGEIAEDGVYLWLAEVETLNSSLRLSGSVLLLNF